MVQWRRLQRGHASFPIALAPATTQRKATVLWRMAALLTLLVVLALAARHLQRTAPPAAAAPALTTAGLQADTAVPMGSQAHASTPPLPLFSDGAALSVPPAAPDLPATSSETGLQRQALSASVVQRLQPQLGQAEARLLEIYRLISETRHREALAQADALVRDHPNFHLAHLVHGDLLSLQIRPVTRIGDVPDTKANAALEQLSVLREESRRRLQALTERPPAGHVPTQFLSLAPQSRHAIAIDASRSRLYLFENQAPATSVGDGLGQAPQLKLVGDYYISVGLQGIEKQVEGDKRTPLGVYYITSSLNPDSLPDLYGVGALPINYPNPLDTQRGKTGSGIWLHGTPSEQFVRAPQASDGCVVLANPDLERLLATVQVRTTPVVIAPELQWVPPEALQADRQRFEAALQAWREAKSQGNLQHLQTFYSDKFRHQGRDLAAWWPRVQEELRSTARGRAVRELELKDVSMLQWRDSQETMVVTFGEVAKGQSRGVTKRQYWALENDQWKIFFEGTP